MGSGTQWEVERNGKCNSRCKPGGNPFCCKKQPGDSPRPILNPQGYFSAQRLPAQGERLLSRLRPGVTQTHGTVKHQPVCA